MQMDFNRRLDVRQKRLESVMESVTERTERSEEEIAALKERLARLEQAG
jgi:predicted  nucleic acid-binding Zn-ribbon protein